MHSRFHSNSAFTKYAALMLIYYHAGVSAVQLFLCAIVNFLFYDTISSFIRYSYLRNSCHAVNLSIYMLIRQVTYTLGWKWLLAYHLHFKYTGWLGCINRKSHKNFMYNYFLFVEILASDRVYCKVTSWQSDRAPQTALRRYCKLISSKIKFAL